jgi:poly-gamma-glutamate synthesis protein (capsule biosynthesis protein)
MVALLWSALTLTVPAQWAHAQAATGSAPSAAPPPARDAGAETLMKIDAPFTVAAVGDIYAPRPFDSAQPQFRRLVDPMRTADAGFANMESSLIDFPHFDGPIVGSLAPLAMGQSMKAIGITLMNRANNHALDGGLGGMMSTDAALDMLGIAHAGSGRNLQEARAASFAETPKGRVGVVGMFAMDDSSAYGPNFASSAATYRNGDLGGAPGVNPLHLTAYHVIGAEQLQNLRETARLSYGNRAGDARGGDGTPERFRFFDEWYEAGADAGALHYEMNAGDEKDILQSVRNGKIYADFLIATIHSHQTRSYKSLGYGGVEHAPADFLVKLAHDCIDNGADLFVAHGVHALGAIEIYRGKPIFYGLSSFVFQFGLQQGPTYDALANEKDLALLETQPNQETVLTTSRFEHGRLSEVRLYPADMGGSRRPISQMGLPLQPSAEEAQRILKELQEASQPFGTKIAIEGEVGIIRMPADTTPTPRK